MNAKTAKRIRKAIGLRGSGPATYAPVEIHHLAEAQVYQTHQRTLRSWDPKARKITARTVEKPLMRADGKTPRIPVMKKFIHEGKVLHTPLTTLLSVAKPVRLAPGSPRAVYLTMKRLEQTVGLDNVYAQVTAEALAAEAA